ncbi:hypothetical protein EVAR_26964_1 [Eumeta japonica]|uniref:Uncharacterized protein n=1 Tax=Eumeta variegata TaxID=151549 RepID=A0A4C1VJ94_EUMVA|nr:hypothetical protein EVAR_26964_1 [Eumeta japonica]
MEAVLDERNVFAQFAVYRSSPVQSRYFGREFGGLDKSCSGSGFVRGALDATPVASIEYVRFEALRVYFAISTQTEPPQSQPAQSEGDQF